MIRRTPKEKAYVGKWKEERHQNHPLHLNPFNFSVHQQSTDTYQIQLAVATQLRVAKQPYSMACRLLEEDSNGLPLGKRAYYNLDVVRNKRAEVEDERTMTALLDELRKDGFRFATRTEDRYEEQQDGMYKVSSQKLIQIFFYHPECVHLAQRFAAGHVLIIDGTFNTNKLRLSLLVAIKIINKEKTFPIAFSFCPKETTESYNFFFNCL